MTFNVVANHNRQALGYMVERGAYDGVTRRTEYTVVGSTAGRHLHFRVDDPPDTSYLYRVVPITMTEGKGRPSSTAFNNSLGSSTCASWQGNALINIVHMFPDVLGNPSLNTVTPRTFDVLTVGALGQICIDYNFRRMQLQRAIYYKERLGEDCGQASVNCVEITFINPENAKEYKEVVSGAKRTRWGLPQWQLTSFSDHTLPPGRYGIFYRACYDFAEDDTRPACSQWLDTGMQDVGDTPTPERTYPDAFRVYG